MTGPLDQGPGVGVDGPLAMTGFGPGQIIMMVCAVIVTAVGWIGRRIGRHRPDPTT